MSPFPAGYIKAFIYKHRNSFSHCLTAERKLFSQRVFRRYLLPGLYISHQDLIFKKGFQHRVFRLIFIFLHGLKLPALYVHVYIKIIHHPRTIINETVMSICVRNVDFRRYTSEPTCCRRSLHCFYIAEVVEYLYTLVRTCYTCKEVLHMLDQKKHTFWFVTGSQHLYGPETLEMVDAHSRTISGVWTKTRQFRTK